MWQCKIRQRVGPEGRGENQNLQDFNIYSKDLIAFYWENCFSRNEREIFLHIATHAVLKSALGDSGALWRKTGVQTYLVTTTVVTSAVLGWMQGKKRPEVAWRFSCDFLRVHGKPGWWQGDHHYPSFLLTSREGFLPAGLSVAISKTWIWLQAVGLEDSGFQSCPPPGHIIWCQDLLPLFCLQFFPFPLPSFRGWYGDTI